MDEISRAKERLALKDASGDPWIEGSIYDEFEAVIMRSGGTVAHFLKYGEAVEICSALIKIVKYEEALHKIIRLRPVGDVEKCKNAQKLVEQMEAIALNAFGSHNENPTA